MAIRVCGACSAPLDPRTGLCPYCGVRNDIDLKGRIDYKVTGPSPRKCPECEIALHTIDLGIDTGFFIEQCQTCKGLFFDPDELEDLLEKLVNEKGDVAYHRIDLINRELAHPRREVTYVKCPICRKFMHRVNFGQRSGVVVDRCKDHGIWLAAGELKHLLAWRQAGGEVLDARAKAREAKAKAKRDEEKRKQAWSDASKGAYIESNSWSSPRSYHTYGEPDLIEVIMDFVHRLFK